MAQFETIPDRECNPPECGSYHDCEKEEVKILEAKIDKIFTVYDMHDEELGRLKKDTEPSVFFGGGVIKRLAMKKASDSMDRCLLAIDKKELQIEELNAKIFS
jgi:hypothetical protein